MTNPIKQIADREFKGNEFKAGFKQGDFMFYGQTKKKNLKQKHNEKSQRSKRVRQRTRRRILWR